jgi:hypothetical protein
LILGGVEVFIGSVLGFRGTIETFQSYDGRINIFYSIKETV